MNNPHDYDDRSFLPRRIFGCETEYGLEILGVSLDIATARLLSGREPARSQFLPNGGRIYQDCSHPEYCTPECWTPKELATYHYAGDLLVEALAERLRKPAGGGLTVTIRRDNVDYIGVSYGCHMNYLIRRSLTDDELIQALVPFLVTSPILFGSGHVSSQGSLYLSPRADAVNCLTSQGNAQVGSRAVLNLRDDSHLPSDQVPHYRRLHITCHDANVSQRATILKAGVTALVLAMAESGWMEELGRYMPEDPVRSLDAINKDIGLAVTVPTRRGPMSALALQYSLHEQAGYFLECCKGHEDIPTWMEEAYRDWGAALDDLATFRQGWSATATWIDWKVKHQLFEQFAASQETVSADMLFALSLEYHSLGLDSLAAEMVKVGRLDAPIKSAEIERAAAVPSSHVRAQERGAVVSKYYGTPVESSVEWTGYRRDKTFYPLTFHPA